MTAIQTDMPLDTTFGKVVWRAVLAIADQTDADRLPDATPAVGYVVFRPAVPNLKTATPEPATVVRTNIRCTINEDGFLIDPQGAEGVWLMTGVYKVSYDIQGAIINTHTIEVLSTHDDGSPLDLTTAIPPSGGTISPSEFAELSARIDALAAGGLDISGLQAALLAMFVPGDNINIYQLAEPNDEYIRFDVMGVDNLRDRIEVLEAATGSGMDPQAVRDIVIAMMDDGAGIDIHSYDPSSVTIRSWHGYRGVWTNFQYYFVGDMVYHAGKFYEALTEGVTGQIPTSNPDDWTLLPVTADAGGSGSTDHGALGGLADDDHPQYLNQARGDARYYTKTNTYTKTEVDSAITGASGTTNHSALSNLAADDHPQYLNATRGDGRYYTKAQIDALISSAASMPQTVDAKTGNYSLVATDAGKLLTFNSTSAMTLTVPTDAAMSWPQGVRVDVIVINTGMVTVQALTPGTTSVEGTPSKVSRARYSAFSLMKIAANSWVVVGDMA